jgi:hypothetical protein
MSRWATFSLLACAVAVSTWLLFKDTTSASSPPNVDLGEQPAGERIDFSIEFEVTENEPLRLAGAQACCGAKVTHFPEVTPSGGICVVRGFAVSPPSGGTFSSEVTLFKDSGALVPLSFKVHGVAITPLESEADLSPSEGDIMAPAAAAQITTAP